MPGSWRSMSSRQGADKAGALHGDVDDALHVRLKDHLPLEGGGGVVKVDDDVLRPADGLEGAADEVFPGLDQHLDGDALWDEVPLDEGAQNLKLRLRGGGEAHLDLPKANGGEHAEKRHLLLQVHGGDKGLVAVAQIHAAPHRRLGEGPPRPGAVRQGDGLEGPVLSIPLVHDISSFPHNFPVQTKRPRRGLPSRPGRRTSSRYHPDLAGRPALWPPLREPGG